MKKAILFITLVLATACGRPQPVSETAPVVIVTSESGLETSVDVPAEPVLSVSVTPLTLIQGAEASIHVRVENTGTTDWNSYDLLVGYGVEDGSSITQIQTFPISLQAGQAFEQDIAWTVDFTPTPNTRYQVELVLVLSDGTVMGDVTTPVEIVEQTLSLSLDSAEARMGSQIIITVQVTNPSGVDMNGITLIVGHGPASDSSMNTIQQIPLSIKAGETFNQDIPWVVDYTPSGDDTQIKAFLITADNVVIATAVPVTLPAP